MSSVRTNFRKGIIAGFGWLCLFVALLLGYWWVMTNYVVRDFWDPSFATKSELLKARLKEYPGHPLWLVLGSSHVDDALRPGLVLEKMRGDHAPLIFNFGFGGADLYRQFVCLRRLVAAGIKPQRVGVEIVGAPVGDKRELYADDPKLVTRARRDEIDELCEEGAEPAETRRTWLQSRWNPFFEYGMQTPYQTASWRLLPIPGAARYLEGAAYDNWGWYRMPAGATPVNIYNEKLEGTRKAYQEYFSNGFTVSDNNQKILRRVLDFCKGAGIGAFLLRMPEDRDLQAVYPPEANAAIDSFMAKIGSEYGVPLIDARSWFPEKDGFVDGHHMNTIGGEMFTRRFADELLALKL